MKSNSIFTCSSCGAQFTKWTGRCLECGKWSTIVESKVKNLKSKVSETNYEIAETKSLSDVEGKDVKRIETNTSELNRVLGGGIVPGSLILLGGEPGIGKSTLALQLASIIKKSLYISGEESIEQIKLRADRLSVNPDYLPPVTLVKAGQDISIANETNTETINATIVKNKPQLVVIDSIQTMWSQDAAGEPGNVNQIRACTVQLLEVAKQNNIPICIIGHVTKDGSVAGPKTLEHLVDTVLYLEGDRYHSYRILRTVKNRFGPTDEVGIFEMTQAGLKEVKNPSASFLQERGENIPGSVITCLMEGTRPVLVEIQALVNKTSFGYPVRKASGFDLNRLHVLVAVLQKRAGLNLSQYDIHLNVVGGIKANEPAADLAVCLAIASSFKDKALGQDLVAFGEVGLGGEVRSVSQTDKRIKESQNLSMKRIILAKSPKSKVQSLKSIEVKNIEELIRKT